MSSTANAPFGVVLVAVLTMLGAMMDFFFAALWLGLGAMGGPPPSGYSPPISYRIVLIGSLVLGGIALAAAVGLLHPARYAWYLTIVLWILSGVHYSYASGFILLSARTIVVFLAIVLNAGLISYFQLKHVRNYFFHYGNDQFKRGLRGKGS
jgi:hypothetical protein